MSVKDHWKAKQAGFTFIELIIAIVLVGILAVVVGPILARPFVAFQNVAERTELVSIAENAMQQMVRDIKNAVPNTIRVNGTVLELTPIQEGGRYRFGPANNPQRLGPSAPDQEFRSFGTITFPANARVVVYNINPTEFYTDAATSPATGVISPAGATASPCGGCGGNPETNVDLGVAHQFDDVGTGSPFYRFYVVTRPLTYHCDVGSQSIMRYEGYGFNQVQETTRATLAAAATSVGMLTDQMSSCSFTYTVGTATRASTITIDLEVEDPVTNESVRLLRQVHIGNAP